MPTTKRMVGNTTVMTSTALPVATMMPNVHSPLTSTTAKGTMTPHAVRKANHKKAMSNTMPTPTNHVTSRSMTPT